MVKVLIVLGIILLILAVISTYQKIKHKNKYSYLSLWNINTRSKTFIKGDHKVMLVGMIHVGNNSYYKKVVNFVPQAEVLSLTEGVGDKEKLKGDAKLDYESLASLVGLSSQKQLAKFPNDVNADIDISEFTPEVRGYIFKISDLISHIERFLKRELTTKELAKKVSEKEIQNLLAFFKSPRKDEELLIRRNDVLWNKFLENEGSHKNIIMPWGAAHLPDMEERLLRQGYRVEKSKSFKALNLAWVGWSVALTYFGGK